MSGTGDPAAPIRAPLRLFVALMLGPELGREARAAADRALGKADARLPRAEGLHLTLFFLGDTAVERVAELEAELARALAGATAPRLTLDHTGAFPGPREPRVLWFGASERGGEGRLEAVRARVLEAVEAAGFDTAAERARPFRPHVTVGRLRASEPVEPGERSSEALRGFLALDPGILWSPLEVALVASIRPGQGPPRYESRAVVPFADDSGDR